MKTKTITQTILTADEGMYLTNGETFGKTAVLPEGADPSDWKEISQESYDEIMNKEALPDA